VAIVGLGGTGSYILDFLAKTPINELHIFDGDLFSSHNAFRAPGAASLDSLHLHLTKVAYHKQTYENMRHEIIAHPYAIHGTNVAELDGMDFVFLCMDGGAVKRTIVEHLLSKGISFIDVGVGLEIQAAKIDGLVAITTSTKEKNDHVSNRISFADADADDEYGSNIQVAELNALNASLAVIKWKKLRGYYETVRDERFTVYTLNENSIVNEDVA
jgi:tRNA A37 threonylcarbamoyladenosine dehydratase